MLFRAHTSDQALLVAALAALLATLLLFWEILDVVIISGSLAVVLMPLHRRFTGRVRETVAALAVCLIVFVSVVFFLAFTIWVFLSNEAYVRGLIDIIFAWVGSPQSASFLASLSVDQPRAVLFLKGIEEIFSRYITTIAGQLLFIGAKVLLFFVCLFLFLWRGTKVYRVLAGSVPGRLRTAFDSLTHTAVDTLYAIYVVHGGIAVVTFLIAFPFFWLLGQGHALFLATASGIMKLNPVIGPSLIMIVLGIQALSESDMRSFYLLLLVGYPLVCALPDLYLRPVLMGRRTTVHPALMWIGYFGGVITMGFVGFIIGPLVLALVAKGYPLLLREIREIENTPDPVDACNHVHTDETAGAGDGTQTGDSSGGSSDNSGGGSSGG